MSLKIYTANKAAKNKTARNIVIFFGMCFLKRYTAAAGGSAGTIGWNRIAARISSLSIANTARVIPHPGQGMPNSCFSGQPTVK